MNYVKKENNVYFLDEYRLYLKENLYKFPLGVKKFVSNSFYFDFDDERCPHDAWLQQSYIKEFSVDGNIFDRKIQIELDFLGNKHTGNFTIIYYDVVLYNLQCTAKISITKKWHGDWIADEVTMDSSQNIRHEIDFRSANWVIYCKDLHYDWKQKQ